MADQGRRYGGMLSMKTWGALAAVFAGSMAAIAGPAGPASADGGGVPTATVSFTQVGEHAFTVPPGVTSIHVVAVGGRGGDTSLMAFGGFGARVEGDLRVIPGTTIYAEVGGNGAPETTEPGHTAAGGANGGGPGGAWTDAELAQSEGFVPASGAGGGGASDIQTCSVATCQPINTGSPALLLVAGGGGGAAGLGTGFHAGRPTVAGAGPAAHCAGRDDAIFGTGGGGGGYYCGEAGASSAELGFVVYGNGGGGGSSYGPAGAQYSVVTENPAVTITYRTAFRLAPASRSSLTLDVAGINVVQQAPSGASSQLWRLTAQGSLYQIVNQATGQCLTTDGAAGDQLFVWPCFVQAQQLWQVPGAFGYGTNGSVIRNPAYDLYVDVSGGSTAAGAAIDARPYNGGANQYFLTF
ncbi:MAG TPA: RICIN domain-containing protein [Dactylosporangium sp.]|nr:RICIN domain-containing protein [Dactylosporangium sp.]